jgi:amidase
LNPFNNSFTPGGSSGGQCGLVAKRGSAFGVCSDSAGSIRIPANFCGIYGFKPTGGRISKKGRVGVTGGEVEGSKELIPSIGPVSRDI